MTPEFWHAEIALLERELGVGGFAERTEQYVDDLAEAIGQYTRTSADLPALDIDYRAAKHFNLASVRELYELFEAASLRGAEFTWPRTKEPILV